MIDIARLERKAICRRIAQARDAAGMTPEGLAQHLEALFGVAVSADDVRRYEKSKVPWRLLDEIGRVTGTSKAWLLYGESQSQGDFPALTSRADGVVTDDVGAGDLAPSGLRRGRILVGLGLGFLVGVSIKSATGSTAAALAGLVATTLLVGLRGGSPAT